MPEYYIGLMSGTSMDAIDAVLVNCSNKNVKLVAHHSQELSIETRKKINELCIGCDDELKKMLSLDTELAIQFANCANALLKKSNISNKSIIAIGSHGQTLRHYPNSPIKNSLQIANPNIIAELTGITTIADFRRRDMTVGGQGAPLVPAFHEKVFRKESQNTIVLNIGGIANITVLPADITKDVIGFDTGPGNGLLDAWIQNQKQLNYDDKGSWAISGTANNKLLKVFLTEPYFQLPYPKSTGRELFNIDWLNKMLENYNLSLPAEDIQASLIELTTHSITTEIHALPISVDRVLVCGGGARNDYLMARLQSQLGSISVSTTATESIEPEWIEAMAFAWLAKQTRNNLPGNIPSVTGANNAVILGAIYSA